MISPELAALDELLRSGSWNFRKHQMYAFRGRVFYCREAQHMNGDMDTLNR